MRCAAGLLGTALICFSPSMHTCFYQIVGWDPDTTSPARMQHENRLLGWTLVFEDV
jgi:hypothetical protein